MRGAGYGEVVTFLERGYDSFKRMHGSRHFRKTLQEREMSILDRFYAHDPDPFRFERIAAIPGRSRVARLTDRAREFLILILLNR